MDKRAFLENEKLYKMKNFNVEKLVLKQDDLEPALLAMLKRYGCVLPRISPDKDMCGIYYNIDEDNAMFLSGTLDCDALRYKPSNLVVVESELRFEKEVINMKINFQLKSRFSELSEVKVETSITNVCNGYRSLCKGHETKNWALIMPIMEYLAKYIYRTYMFNHVVY